MRTRTLLWLVVPLFLVVSASRWMVLSQLFRVVEARLQPAAPVERATLSGAELYPGMVRQGCWEPVCSLVCPWGVVPALRMERAFQMTSIGPVRRDARGMITRIYLNREDASGRPWPDLKDAPFHWTFFYPREDIACPLIDWRYNVTPMERMILDDELCRVDSPLAELVWLDGLHGPFVSPH